MTAGLLTERVRARRGECKRRRGGCGGGAGIGAGKVEMGGISLARRGRASRSAARVRPRGAGPRPPACEVGRRVCRGCRRAESDAERVSRAGGTVLAGASRQMASGRAPRPPRSLDVRADVCSPRPEEGWQPRACTRTARFGSGVRERPIYAHVCHPCGHQARSCAGISFAICSTHQTRRQSTMVITVRMVKQSASQRRTHFVRMRETFK
jgi:hypothetical protein